MRVALKDKLADVEELEVEVDETLANIVFSFINSCIVRGVLKKGSPLLTMIMAEGLRFCREDEHHERH